MAQDRDRWQAVENTAVSFQVALNASHETSLLSGVRIYLYM